MSRVLALLALVLIPVAGFGQDTEDSDIVFGDGAVAVSGDEGGRPACACSPGLAGLPVGPTLAVAALVARRRRR